MPYNAEAIMWGEFIAEKKPGAKIAELTFNNDFGKVYSTTMQEVAATRASRSSTASCTRARRRRSTTRSPRSWPPTQTSCWARRRARSAPKLMAGLAAGGYKGITIISSTCASVASFFKPVDPAGNGVYLLLQQKDPSDPQFADDPAVVEYKADIAKYARRG